MWTRANRKVPGGGGGGLSDSPPSLLSLSVSLSPPPLTIESGCQAAHRSRCHGDRSCLCSVPQASRNTVFLRGRTSQRGMEREKKPIHMHLRNESMRIDLRMRQEWDTRIRERKDALLFFDPPLFIQRPNWQNALPEPANRVGISHSYSWHPTPSTWPFRHLPPIHSNPTAPASCPISTQNCMQILSAFAPYHVTGLKHCAPGAG